MHYLVNNGAERMQNMRIQYNMKNSDLRDKAGISANSVAKLGKNEPVRMDILMKIAEALDCNVEDLFETVKGNSNQEKI